MQSFKGLKVGDKLRCINSEGWNKFKEGGVYIVTDVWQLGIDLDGQPVSSDFCSDFEFYGSER